MREWEVARMARCKWCGRFGWRMHVTANGLCVKCDPVVAQDIAEHQRIINNSARLVQESRRSDALASEYDVLLDHARALVRYEKRGIPTTHPLPSALVREYQAKRGDLTLETLSREVKDAVAEAHNLVGSQAKISRLSDVLAKIQQCKAASDVTGRLAALEEKIAGLIHQTQLDEYIDEARRAELSGQRKRAREHYRKVLDFLTQDDMSGLFQESSIKAIERKIAELGGQETPATVDLEGEVGADVPADTDAA
jgi:hypothetical protein